MKTLAWLSLVAIFSACFFSAKTFAQDPVPFGDPFIYNDNGTYYMYGTSEPQKGIKVYQSTDLKHWIGPVGATGGFALAKDDVWGNTNYWAPEVYHYNGKYYMFFSVEEHIAVAIADNPKGPFNQQDKAPLLGSKAIDTHLFVDDDGRKYLYYVAFTNGNVIWMAEMNDDLLSIKKNTIQKCIEASQVWEFSKKEPVAKVNEGPFMLKHNGTYYLVYSANHFANPDYGIGYATSSAPTGPWTKYIGNPILSSNDSLTGPGHCGFFNDQDGNLFIVYHTHFSSTQLRPRIVHINRCEFVKNSGGGPDILKILPPEIKSEHTVEMKK